MKLKEINKENTKIAVESYQVAIKRNETLRQEHLDSLVEQDDEITIGHLEDRIKHLTNNIIISMKQIEILELQLQVEEHRQENLMMKLGMPTV